MKNNFKKLLLIVLFFQFNITILLYSEPCDTTGSEESLYVDNEGYSQLSYSFLRNGNFFSIKSIMNKESILQQGSNIYLKEIIKDIVRNSQYLLGLSDGAAEEPFTIIIQIPSCMRWGWNEQIDSWESNGCPGECCTRILTLKKNYQKMVILNISPVNPNDPTACLPEATECSFVCNIFDEISEDEASENNCFNYMCDSPPYVLTDNQNNYVTYSDTTGSVNLFPLFAIQDCDDWINITLSQVIKKNGDWSGMSDDDILFHLIKYALKYLTGIRQNVNVRFSLPCFTRVDSLLVLCETESCCYIDYRVTRNLGKVFAEEIPLSHELQRTCYSNIPIMDGTEELLALTNCYFDCYWKTNGNDDIDDSYEFIGPTDGSDFIVKTKNANGDLLNRILVDNNSRIDFNLNRWNSLPQISLDADPVLVDPKIKLYRPTGTSQYEAFPWWISVTGTSGTGTNTCNGTFDIWAGSPAVIGTENMNKVFTILNNGNVGIGVDIPKSKLELNGDLRVHGIFYTTEIIVKDPAGWPDFVFDKNYSLTSLTDISDFIKKFGHLPEVPSQETIKDEGIKLVEMQKILLKKIEELTLHMIELKEENEQIKSELKKIKEENK